MPGSAAQLSRKDDATHLKSGASAVLKPQRLAASVAGETAVKLPVLQLQLETRTRSSAGMTYGSGGTVPNFSRAPPNFPTPNFPRLRPAAPVGPRFPERFPECPELRELRSGCPELLSPELLSSVPNFFRVSRTSSRISLECPQLLRRVPNSLSVPNYSVPTFLVDCNAHGTTVIALREFIAPAGSARCKCSRVPATVGNDACRSGPFKPVLEDALG